MKQQNSILIFVFSVLIYVLSLSTLFLFAMFLLNIGTYTVSLTTTASTKVIDIRDLLINIGLLTLFGVSHSIMARPKFKQWIVQYIGKPLIRPVYLLISVLTLSLLILFWTPFGGVIYSTEGSLLWYILIALNIIGWIVEVTSSFQINHFHLFGLSQTYANLRQNKTISPEFTVPLYYRFVRHPIYTGWLMVFWFTPVMTVSHLFLAIALTIYIRIATNYD